MAEKSKEIISKKLLELMKKESFKNITISEICANASLVRKTFYNNFKSKEEVIEYTVDKLVFDFLEIIQKKEYNIVKEIALEYFLFGKKNDKIILLLIENKMFHIFQNSFLRLLPVINNLITDNKMKNLNQRQLEYIFAFNSAGVNQILATWIQSDYQETAEELSNVYEIIAKGFDY